MEIWARVTLAFIAVYLITCLSVIIEPSSEPTTSTGPNPVFFEKLFAPPIDAVPNAVPGQAS
jgi:hypothetical protein